MPVGPGSVLDALAAVRAAGVGTREDFYWTLHAVFVKRHEHSVLFDQAFRIFFRKRGYLDKLIAMMSPEAPGAPAQPNAPQASQRVHEALFSGQPRRSQREKPEIEIDARFTVSDREVLQKKDFAQMTRGRDRRGQGRDQAPGAAASTRSRRAGSRRTRTATASIMRRTLARQHEGRRRADRPEISRAARPSRRRSWRCSIFPAR